MVLLLLLFLLLLLSVCLSVSLCLQSAMVIFRLYFISRHPFIFSLCCLLILSFALLISLQASPETQIREMMQTPCFFFHA